MNLIFRLIGLFIGYRRRSKLDMWDTARTPFRVWPTDLDLLMHMNNGKYLSLLDLGRMDLLLRSGSWKKIKAAGWYPVVASQTISYRRSLNPFVKFEIVTRLLGLGEGGVYIEQTFVVGDDVYAQAVVRARFLKKSGGKVTNEELADLTGVNVADHPVPTWVDEWGARSKTITKTIS